jgi:hypothetical protein
MIRLEELERDPGKLIAELILDIAERLRAVDVRFAHAEEIQVRSVDDK